MRCDILSKLDIFKHISNVFRGNIGIFRMQLLGLIVGS